MATRTLPRSYGKVFDQIAHEYDRRRPSYPEALLDHVCELAGLADGDHVLEIGCGTGQLTRDLLGRGLRVSAIEPGSRLLALAHRNLAGLGPVDFVNARFEDAPLPGGSFEAVLSASAIHWIDPELGWQKAAAALAPGGTLALIQFFGVNDPRSEEDQRALLGTIARIAPELAAAWPSYRGLEQTLAGVEERRANISEVWAWLGGYDIASAHAGRLFAAAEIAVEPRLIEQTPAELNGLLATMSFWSKLSPPQRAAIEAENRALCERLGRPIRSSLLACAVTARRAA
jgi:SAM-dependent methyltransferase